MHGFGREMHGCIYLHGALARLTATLREQQVEAAKLDASIFNNLKELGYGE